MKRSHRREYTKSAHVFDALSKVGQALMALRFSHSLMAHHRAMPLSHSNKYFSQYINNAKLKLSHFSA